MTARAGARTGVREAADRIERAYRDGRPVAPIRDLVRSDDVDAAYEVQTLLTRRRLASGAVIVGRKIGITSEAVQKQVGVDQPDFGVLFDDMRYADGDTIPVTALIQPKAEAEVAFVLAADLDTADLDRATVEGAVDHAVAALEIVDSRIRDWDITIADTVADNASSGAFVLGDRRVGLDVFRPVDVEMSMSVNGRTLSSGDGTACLGDPLDALAWLARTVHRFGSPLRRGDIVLSGALGPMIPLTPGQTVTASLTHLGSVSVSYGHKEQA